MNVRRRLAAVAVALLVPALLLARWSVGGTPLESVPAVSLPRSVGPWTAFQDEQLSAEVWSIIEPDAHLMRLYLANGRTPIWLYVGFYAGRVGSGKSAHDPEVCYPAQGWEIMQSQSRDIEVENGEGLRVMVLEAHNELRKEAVLYWFQPAGRWPRGSPLEELLRVTDALAGQPQYAFVRLSGPTDGGPTSARDLAEFASALAPAARSAVDQLRAAVTQ